jgi:hypothetical protein
MRFWSVQRILTTIAILPWAYLVWSGCEFYYGARVHAVPGFPNQGQFHLYVMAPSIGLLVGLALFVLANKIPGWLERTCFFIQFVALVPVLAIWGGGI